MDLTEVSANISDQTAQPTNEAKASELITIRDDGLMRLWRRQGVSTRLVVCCSSVGHHDGRPPVAEFNRLAYWESPDHLLFFADPQRTWLNANGLIEALVQAIESEAARVGATEVCIVGFSMGAYTAMVMPAFTKISIAIAFSPQYIVDPVLVPDETRWESWRLAIKNFRIKSVADHIVPHCSYFVFHGRNRRESLQRNLVKPLDNLDMFIIQGTYHRTPKRLSEAGVLDAVIEACLANDRPRLFQIMKDPINAEIVTKAVLT